MTADDSPLYPFFGPMRLLVFAHDYAPGAIQGRHRHDVPQLLHAQRGVMRMSTPAGYWVIPPGRGVWIPAFIAHEVRMVGPVSMRTLYVGVAMDCAPANGCAVVEVSPLLQRLMEELAGAEPPAPAEEARRAAMEELALIEIARLPTLPWHVPLPRAPRLRALCERILARPEDSRTLDELAERAGVSSRTLRRLFQQETGMSFCAWRQQVRLVEALARLAEGEAVTAVSQAVGYATPSAFTAMFKRVMGRTPGHVT